MFINRLLIKTSFKDTKFSAYFILYFTKKANV